MSESRLENCPTCGHDISSEDIHFSHCGACDGPMSGDAKYCSRCGEEKTAPPLEAAPVVAPPAATAAIAAQTFDVGTGAGLPSPVQPTQRPGWIVLLAVPLVIFVAVALWLGLRGGGDSSSASEAIGGSNTSETIVALANDSTETLSSTIPTATVAPTTTTTTPTSTTTPAAVVLGVEIYNTVNGLPPDSDGMMNRRAIAIKIDDHGSARPQSGLAEADLVYEMLIEGGLTRFAAVFHQSDLEWVGPIHSGRVTDVGALRWLDGVLQISGAQSWVKDVFRTERLRALSDTGVSTWRESHRSGPHNLYSSTLMIRDQADGLGWPDENPGNVFAFGDPTEGDAPATDIHFGWSDQTDIVWEWNGEAYERHRGDTPHTWVTEDSKTEDGEIVTTPMLVVIKGPVRTDSGPAGEGTSLPTTETIGEGAALVFAEGAVVEGHWRRDAYTDMFELTTENGGLITINPSKMWIIIFPDDRPIIWE